MLANVKPSGYLPLMVKMIDFRTGYNGLEIKGDLFSLIGKVTKPGQSWAGGFPHARSGIFYHKNAASSLGGISVSLWYLLA